MAAPVRAMTNLFSLSPEQAASSLSHEESGSTDNVAAFDSRGRRARTLFLVAEQPIKPLLFVAYSDPTQMKHTL